VTHFPEKTVSRTAPFLHACGGEKANMGRLKNLLLGQLLSFPKQR